MPDIPVSIIVVARRMTFENFRLCARLMGCRELRFSATGSSNCCANDPPICPCRLVVIAGDISPIDVISHLPVLCEDSALPFVFTASKAELGGAAATKRPTSVVFISTTLAKKNASTTAKVDKDGKPAVRPPVFDADDKFAEAVAEIKSITPVY